LTQIAFIADQDVPVDELTAAIWADAADRQLKEICDAWSVPYTPVVFYKSAEGLPPDARVANLKMTLDAPGALAYHDYLAGLVFSRILYTNPLETPVSFTHEDGEESVDPKCDRWCPYDEINEQALEICDRVEGDVYVVQGAVGKRTLDVFVSNFLYPSAFDPNGKKPFDKMGKLNEWDGMTSGGYVILRSTATGDVRDVFARRRLPRVVSAGPAAGGRLMRRLARPDSRLMRRLRSGGSA
jgi:hypothetical protein